MKKMISLLILLAALQVQAQTKDEQQILSVLEEQTRAWNDGDIDRFMIGYWQHDSLMFIGKNGVTYGYNQTLANYKKNYPDRATMGKLKFTIVKLNRIAADTYFIVGKWHLTLDEKSSIGGHYTLLFKKIKKSWVIVADHSS
jgi:ketosteroid isomerase-like protein